MRDVRDWNKYVDMVGKTVSKRPIADTAAPPAPDGSAGAADAIAPPPGDDLTAEAEALAPRKGRGPRKEETREELLARLLDPTLTLEETARILEVCPTTVRRYTNKGILPHERSQGNQRRFKLSSVIAFRESQMRLEPNEEPGMEPS